MTRRVRLRIDTIAAGGDGVGRHDGLVIFVPRSAPGDTLDVAIEAKGRFARGRILQVIEPSADRAEPPCAHYTADRCGGCQLQHVRYAAQLEAKAAVVRDALERIGRRAVPPFQVEPSPSQWRYRSKLTLALRRRGGTWIAGLRAFDDPRAVFALRDCPITDERVVAAWHEVLEAGALMPAARELRGAVRVGDQGLSLVLEGGRSWRDARAFADRARSLRAVWWQPDGGVCRTVVDRRAAASPDASFAQVNRAAAARLHDCVVAMVLAHTPATVVDGYAGSGETAVSIAAHGARVTAIEMDPAAARWAGQRLAAPSRAVAARVEHALPATLPADVVVLNPPRTGLDERVTRALQAVEPSPRALIYVSCDPATLARDLTRVPSYRLTSVRAFDLFPQTAHVETVCELIPEAA